MIYFFSIQPEVRIMIFNTIENDFIIVMCKQLYTLQAQVI